MDFVPFITNLDDSKSMATYNGVKRAMDECANMYQKWNKYLQKDNMPASMLQNENLSKLDEDKLSIIGQPPEKLLVYAFASLCEFDALRKKLVYRF